MKKIIRKILAVLTGIVIGGTVNMSIIMISGSVIPPPAGADVTTMEGLQESMHLFQPKHFLMPFLAHALGTFVGALFTAFIVTSHKMEYALSIGVFFLLGGIANVVMLPSPTWFAIADVVLAYIPVAYSAGWLIQKYQTPKRIGVEE
ncbi:MAG TPA: hypothetical protein DD671_14190 [Balneolaceae bacterium]|nr:hypothetical protein [Balneola sp.]HBQ60726.1 hypothetical protein [Balneolaceae bacterium]|tara:strand:- start:32018 stop:32458 length:441 start_codon:yes stop_codon:yes gene_type:complete